MVCLRLVISEGMCCAMALPFLGVGEHHTLLMNAGDDDEDVCFNVGGGRQIIHPNNVFCCSFEFMALQGTRKRIILDSLCTDRVRVTLQN